MKEKNDPMTPLKDVISRLLSNSGLAFNPDDTMIWEVWDDAVGPAIARHAQPSWIKKRRLRVKVSDPIWLQELEFVEDTIREKLNHALGREAIERIDFRLGPV